MIATKVTNVVSRKCRLPGPCNVVTVMGTHGIVNETVVNSTFSVRVVRKASDKRLLVDKDIVGAARARKRRILVAG